MAQPPPFFDRLRQHNSMALDVIRIFLGVALFIRGVLFITDQEALLGLIEQTSVGSMMPVLLAGYVAIGHLVGGLMLAFGLGTRLAALFQLPILIGAVVFVHLAEGLFAPGQSLELAVMTLFLLGIFAVSGAGHLSLDYHIFGKESTATPVHPPISFVQDDDDAPARQAPEAASMQA